MKGQTLLYRGTLDMLRPYFAYTVAIGVSVVFFPSKIQLHRSDI
jgi:hypothetical protein